MENSYNQNSDKVWITAIFKKHFGEKFDFLKVK